MVDQSISMNVNDTLELDYLVEEVSDSVVSFNKNPNGKSDTYVSRNSYIFDPNGTGTYEFDIKGQTIEVEVTDIPDSVVTRWPMDEGGNTTINDSKNNFNLEKQGNSAWVNDSNYIGGYYLDFDGDDYLSPSGSTPTVPSGSYAIPVTLRLDNDITSIKTPYRWENSDATSAMAYITGLNGTNDLLFRAVNDSGSSFDAQTTLSQGNNRVVGVLDTANSELKMALNGSFVDTVSVSGSFTSPPDDEFAIGRRPTSTERYWTDGIDEPMIADSAWTSTELSDDYNRQPWS